MLVNDRVRVASLDSTNGRVGTIVAYDDEEAVYRVRLDGQTVEYNHTMAFDAAELEVLGTYVVRLRRDHSSYLGNRYLAAPGGSRLTTFDKAHRFDIDAARREADRYPTWREVVSIAVKRMITRPVYGLKKVAA